MRRHVGVRVAFFIGVGVGGIAAFAPYGLPIPLSLFVPIFSPAWILGLRLADALPQNSDVHFLRFLILSLSACANGLCLASIWAISGRAFEGRRVLGRIRSLLFVLMVLGLSTAFYLVTQWLPANPPSEPPLAAFATNSPLTGRWEGVAHAARGNPPAVLICRPRVDGTLDADLYVNGQPMAAIQEGRVAGDSLYFTIWGFSYFGERRGDSLSVEEIYGSRSMNWTMALHLASRDTASRL